MGINGREVCRSMQAGGERKGIMRSGLDVSLSQVGGDVGVGTSCGEGRKGDHGCMWPEIEGGKRG